MGTLDKRTIKGNAPIKRIGHSSGNQYGQNPRATNTKRQAPREERP
jgi:hypothetical protein